MDYSMLFAIGASAVLTPLLIKLWGRLTPPAATSPFDHLGIDTLRARNGWMDHVVTVLMIVGICVLLVCIYYRVVPSFWLLAMGFGLAVILPFAFIAAVTLPQGSERFHEFWRFYELNWGIGLRGIQLLYIPLAILGLISLVMVVYTA